MCGSEENNLNYFVQGNYKIMWSSKNFEEDIQIIKLKSPLASNNGQLQGKLFQVKHNYVLEKFKNIYCMFKHNLHVKSSPEKSLKRNAFHSWMKWNNTKITNEIIEMNEI